MKHLLKLQKVSYLYLLPVSKIKLLMELYIIDRRTGKHVKKSGHPTVVSEKDELDFLTAAMKCGK